MCCNTNYPYCFVVNYVAKKATNSKHLFKRRSRRLPFFPGLQSTVIFFLFWQNVTYISCDTAWILHFGLYCSLAILFVSMNYMANGCNILYYIMKENYSLSIAPLLFFSCSRDTPRIQKCCAMTSSQRQCHNFFFSITF